MSDVAELHGVLRLGDILVEQGVITEEQLSLSLRFQRDTGARLGATLTELGYATPDQIAAALAWQSTWALSALCEINNDPATVGMLSEQFCRARRVLPIRFNSRGTLMLAMVDPSDIVTIDDARLITAVEISPVPVSLAGFEEALQAVYAHTKRLEVSFLAGQEEGQEGPSGRELAEYEGVVSLVNDILAAAVRHGASAYRLGSTNQIVKDNKIVLKWQEEDKQFLNDSDKEIIRFVAKCFDRPAFQDRFIQERRIEDFDKAIEDTITAINTGSLKNRDGKNLVMGRGKTELSSSTYRKEMDNIVKLLRKIRKIYLEKVNSGEIHLSPRISPKGERFYCINNQELADLFDEMRKEVLNKVNFLLEKEGIYPLYFPIEL